MLLFIRQILFNIAFYGMTAVCCVTLLPFTLLPRKQYIIFLTMYFQLVHILEKYILGLDFEVRGAENIPKDGGFIVAAKHYSAYETMKPHVLFYDPAIIMKKELQFIPIWGLLATKARMIFINRGSRDVALNSIIDGAKRIAQEGRPLVIFPQGTRVSVDDTVESKPYKGGIIRMYEASGMPILPLATNSGLFWAKKAFFKYPGKVIFEFLPAIPAGEDSKEVMEKLKTELEAASRILVEEERMRRQCQS
ncbi:MAG: 1-acyl-sn-glycerol-3-phosphate acyltransferase [Pseudobdellovibrionaceae bacterium]|jgi:1-acyl-sn-glycerol-3-phosphate acyltransferase|nr:1-acyl-sn-glycerol-3-phosphate acyltransferase [Pseudobdellovibrionaceae bacterium]